MISLLLSSAFAFVLVIFATPVAIKQLRKHNIGQFIQAEVEGHMHKQGVPTMGGVVIVGGVVLGYLVSHFKVFTFGDGFVFSVQEIDDKALLAVFALVGMGVIGFADDFVKYARKRNEGLSKRWKFSGQLFIAVVFAWGASAAGVSHELSFARPLGIDLGPILFFLLVLFMLTATANAVNLTDGLDGLVAGSSALVFGAFVLIGFWQSRNFGFYQVDGALDLAVFAAAVSGAVLAFLWWNAAPAKIIMGDTGSHALGGAMAALALLTNTQLLLIILGGFVRDGDVVGHSPGVLLSGIRKARLPHGANPSPLRNEGLAGDDRHRSVLDHLWHDGRRRSRSVLCRLGLRPWIDRSMRYLMSRAQTFVGSQRWRQPSPGRGMKCCCSTQRRQSKRRPVPKLFSGHRGRRSTLLAWTRW